MRRKGAKVLNEPKLKRVLRLDSIPLDETYWTKEGYLIDHPVVTSTGIFEYQNPDGTTRRELRLPEEVFDPASLASYKGKPVILTHEAGVVDKRNVDQEHIGTILSEGYQDGENVRAEIIIHDTDIMKKSGLRELSLGYALDLDRTPGVWKGQPYDAIQRNIRINHLALVDKARAGEKARLNIDGFVRKLKGGKKNMANTNRNDGTPMTPEDLAATIKAYKDRQAARTPGADGDDPVPATGTAPAADAGSAVSPAAPAAVGGEKNDGDDPVQMVKDRRDRRDSDGDPDDMDKAMGVIAQQDEDICTLLDVIEGMKAKQDFDSAAGEGAPKADGEDTTAKDGDDNCTDGDDKGSAINADAADAIFRTRIELVRLGDKLHLDGIETMGVLDAQKAIIKAVNPTMRLDGKSPAYIKAAFDLAKDTMNARKDTNYQRAQMMNGTRRADGAGSKPAGAKAARQRMIDNMGNGGNK
ncbi:DUF2213 domain-containing protein [Oscillibacter sp.]|uniref:DUF2213 domain-containing protein n=1 Tax=Oscillibacter sp. TaxID=1945593 RepID=UPI00257960C7|nr:DUF2213 domain-containing protein [Oscillibacter sp.]